MTSFAKVTLALVAILAHVSLPVTAKPSIEELIGIDAQSCSKNSACCTLATVTSPFAEPGVQNVATSDLTMVAPAHGVDCDCGENLAAKYTTCASLPLRDDSTYEAYVFSNAVGLSLGGFSFAPPDDVYPAVSVCLVTSRCSGTFGFYQSGLELAAKIPNPVKGPLELELKGVMLSALSEIEFETSTGLWNGGVELSDPLMARGQAYLAGSLSIDLEMGGFNCTLSMNGQLLFAMDLGKVAKGLDTIFKTTLGGGKLDFSASDLPGFQLTASVTVSFTIELSPVMSFKLPNIGGATVTMGVNMQQVYGGAYAGFTNGLYACLYQQMSITDFVPFLADIFPTVSWPAYYSDKCLFVSTSGFGFRTTMTISLFGGSFDTLFSMDNNEATFAVNLDAWVITSSIAVVLPYSSGAPSFGFTLTCGSSPCVDAIVAGLNSQAVSRLESAARNFFNNNILAAAVEVERDDDVEGLLNELEMGAEIFKKKSLKKAGKTVSKGTTDTTKATADAAKKTADDAAKAAADLANTFKTESPYIKVSNLSASGTLESFQLSLRFEAGIKLCGQTYSTTQNIAISWNPDSLFSDLANAIPMPF